MASVMGIDFGNDSCFVAVGRGGGIETIDNDYSLRATPSYVALWEKTRVLGVAAKNRHTTNIKNTIFGFKRLLGKSFDDPIVQQWAGKVPFTTVPMIDTTHGTLVGVKVQYREEERLFSMDQIAAMLFTKLKMTTEAALLNQTTQDCVVSVPSYFNYAERNSLLQACKIAGLNVLELMNETTATALTYGLYKQQDLPEPDANPRNVIFVDFGQSSLQVSACAFNQRQLKVLSTSSDAYIGGRNFDELLAKHFCNQFAELHGMDILHNHRAYLRLLTEVEKLKKQMSTVTNKLQLNVEALVDDKDVSSSLSRDEFEKIAAELFYNVEETLKASLKDSGLELTDIYSVEIVGGSTRIPAVKRLIEKVFHMVPSTTLNQDEAVVRGCALKCAMLSPKHIVRDFKIIDENNPPIPLITDQEMSAEAFNQLVEQELEMVHQDKQEWDRIDTKNSVEEFIYMVRENLESKEYADFISDEQQSQLAKALQGLELWIYGEGVNEPKTAYIQRFHKLQALVQPILDRRNESQMRTKAFQIFSDFLNAADAELNKIRINHYSHLTDQEISDFQNACKSCHEFLATKLELLQSFLPHLPSPVKASEIYDKLNEFKLVIEPIINKPIPKVEIETSTHEIEGELKSEFEPVVSKTADADPSGNSEIKSNQDQTSMDIDIED